MRLRSLAVAGAVVLLTAPAFADNTDEATITVQGHVVAPLEIAVINGTVTMPDVVLPAAGEPISIVWVTCSTSNDASNNVFYSNNGNPFADGVASNFEPQTGSANAGIAGAAATGTCAEFVVTGESDYNFSIDIASLTSPTTPGVTITNARCTSETALNISVPQTFALSGTDHTFRCAAGVKVASNAVDYTDGSYTVVVTYD
jgi:hypothetical protein